VETTDKQERELLQMINEREDGRWELRGADGRIVRDLVLYNKPSKFEYFLWLLIKGQEEQTKLLKEINSAVNDSIPRYLENTPDYSEALAEIKREVGSTEANTSYTNEVLDEIKNDGIPVKKVKPK
jgi:hypothetical protein